MKKHQNFAGRRFVNDVNVFVFGKLRTFFTIFRHFIDQTINQLIVKMNSRLMCDENNN